MGTPPSPSSLAGKDRRDGRTYPGMGLDPARPVPRPLRRSSRPDSERIDLDLDRDEGDRSHCARDTRPGKDPCRPACRGIPLHPGDGALLRALQEGEPLHATAHGRRPRACGEVPPRKEGGYRGNGAQGRAGGRLVPGSPRCRAHPGTARATGPRSLPSPFHPRSTGPAHRVRRQPEAVHRTRKRDKETR